MKTQCKLYLLLALLLSFSVHAQNTDHIIEVNGVGAITVDNSEGRINASVTTNHLDADQALMANNNIMNNILSELSNVGIDGNDVVTNQFRFQPQYSWDEGQYQFIGYTVTNGVEVTVSDINAVGAVLNLLVDAGATRVNSVGFGSSSLTEIRKQALAKATEDAHTKAQILADSTGVVLGNVIQVKSLSYSSVLPENNNNGAISASIEVPISAGTNVYTESVKVIYSIQE